MEQATPKPGLTTLHRYFQAAAKPPSAAWISTFCPSLFSSQGIGSRAHIFYTSTELYPTALPSTKHAHFLICYNKWFGIAK